MPESFQERRQPRPFRIVYISMKALLERFILRKPAAPEVPPSDQVQVPVPGPEKALPWRCGVVRLDEQYEALFKLIRKVQGALKSGADPEVREAVLAALGNHVAGHLEMEEAYLERIGFPGLVGHRMGHQAFRHQIHALHGRISAGDPSAGMELSQLLFAWLRIHVAKEDPVWSEFALARRRR